MDGKLMHAVLYRCYGGGPDDLQYVEVPLPAPKKNEVLLKIECVSINPVDWKIQEGEMKPFVPRKFPYIPVTDIAGDIVEVGPGVKNFTVGDKVVAKQAFSDAGGFAEYVVVKDTAMAKRPDDVSAADGAALPIAALTALQAVTESAGINLHGNSQQMNILITAASGGVGHYAVQLAKLGNTHVTATCGARNIELVRSLGADEVLDYKTPEGAALAGPSGKKYDIVIHCAPSIPWSTFERNLNSKGKVIEITPTFGTFVTSAIKMLTFSDKKLVPLVLSFKIENLEFVLNLMKEGKLKTVIDSKYPLDRAQDAWAHSIGGHATGKIIVEPGKCDHVDC